LPATVWATTGGAPWPQGAPPARLLDLALSGVVGLVIGDTLLFQSFVWLGPRLAMLLMALAPPMSALIAWLVLGEQMSTIAIGGMLLTLLGITWVVLERRPGAPDIPSRRRALGILLAIGAAAGQAGGAVLAKRGMLVLDPLSATLVRMASATCVLVLAALVSGQFSRMLPRFRRPRFLAFVLSASFLGPYLGVWFSLVSLKLTETGVALTLMAMSPIFIIPLSARVFGERPTARTVIGTVIAVLGVVILLQRQQ